MKNIYCIVGPSGSGKSTLANALAERYGYKVIESYTTRPPRQDGEKGHIFVSSEEFKGLGEKYAYNVYDGYEYGVTAEQIKENDLFVVEPSGVLDLLDRYRGEKGIKVFGLNPAVEVLIERMQERGDSDEKIIRRLSADAETFHGLDYITNNLFVRDYTVDEMCETLHSWIGDYERAAQHEFSLLNEHGDVVDYSLYASMEEALDGLKQIYPGDLPEGWTVKDETAAKKDVYKKAIKQLNPKFKTSAIYIDPSLTSFSYKGDIVVPFMYGNKRYVYHENYGNGEAWIHEINRIKPIKAGKDILARELELLYTTRDAILPEKLELLHMTEDAMENKLKLEACVLSSQLEKKRIENAISFLSKALELSKQKPALENLISDAQLKADGKLVPKSKSSVLNKDNSELIH